MQKLRSACYLGIALVAFTIGLIGIVVPGLPGVVFMLIAAWAASRGHPGFHRWLRENRFFGQQVRDWEETRTMPFKAKCYAYACLLVSAVAACVVLHGWGLVAAVAVLACVVAGIAAIPTTPPSAPDI